MDEYYIKMIDLLKQQITSGKVNDGDISALLLKLGKDIDRCKVNQEPCLALERLYEEVMWLKCEVSKEKGNG